MILHDPHAAAASAAKHATGLSVADKFLPVGWQVHHISWLQNAAQTLHVGILGPLSKVRVFQIHHGVAIIGVVHRVGVHAVEGVVSRNQQKALAACHLCNASSWSDNHDPEKISCFHMSHYLELTLVLCS